MANKIENFREKLIALKKIDLGEAKLREEYKECGTGIVLDYLEKCALIGLIGVKVSTDVLMSRIVNLTDKTFQFVAQVDWLEENPPNRTFIERTEVLALFSDGWIALDTLKIYFDGDEDTDLEVRITFKPSKKSGDLQFAVLRAQTDAVGRFVQELGHFKGAK